MRNASVSLQAKDVSRAVILSNRLENDRTVSWRREKRNMDYPPQPQPQWPQGQPQPQRPQGQPQPQWQPQQWQPQQWQPQSHWQPGQQPQPQWPQGQPQSQ